MSEYLIPSFLTVAVMAFFTNVYCGEVIGSIYEQHWASRVSQISFITTLISTGCAMIVAIWKYLI